MVRSGTVRTATNGGSELLIFVPRAAHRKTWVQPASRGKQQLRRGLAVPQVTPQARRAQNGMPVELLT